MAERERERLFGTCVKSRPHTHVHRTPDAMSCDGLSDIQNSDQSLNVVSFVWSPLRPASLCFKVNCLSTEFAARKHGESRERERDKYFNCSPIQLPFDLTGGEKGALLRLEMDTFCIDPSNSSSPQHFHHCACNIKVFKDKGADRKQRQDQLKMEKLPQNDLVSTSERWVDCIN